MKQKGNKDAEIMAAVNERSAERGEYPLMRGDCYPKAPPPLAMGVSQAFSLGFSIAHSSKYR